MFSLIDEHQQGLYLKFKMGGHGVLSCCTILLKTVLVTLLPHKYKLL